MLRHHRLVWTIGITSDFPASQWNKVIPLRYVRSSHWYAQNLSGNYHYGKRQNPYNGPQSSTNMTPSSLSYHLFPSVLVTLGSFLSFVIQGMLALQDICTGSFACLEHFSPNIYTVNSFPYSLLTGHLSNGDCLVYPLALQTDSTLLSPVSVLLPLLYFLHNITIYITLFMLLITLTGK